jgi:ubiquinone/menaquinone biosynthesis C-methylase UbiE
MSSAAEHEPRLVRRSASVRSGVCLVLLIALFLLPFANAEEPKTTAPASAPSTRYTSKRAAADGIGKVYMGREIAQVMGHAAADWLDRPEREEEEAPKKAIEMMKLKATDVVADIGAGCGYFSLLMAAKLPQGKVLAEDIQQEMLDLITKRAKEKGVKNIETILGTIEDPKLPENGVDVVLFVDAYHEFDHPFEMMTAIVKALKPGGHVVQLEYRGEDPEVPIKPHHKMTEAQARKEMEAVGLKFVENRPGLPRQHMLIFEKPQPSKPAQ